MRSHSAWSVFKARRSGAFGKLVEISLKGKPALTQIFICASLEHRKQRVIRDQGSCSPPCRKRDSEKSVDLPEVTQPLSGSAGNRRQPFVLGLRRDLGSHRASHRQGQATPGACSGRFPVINSAQLNERSLRPPRGKPARHQVEPPGLSRLAGQGPPFSVLC